MPGLSGREVLTLLAATLLGYAMHERNGSFHLGAMVALTAAWVLVGLALGKPRWRVPERFVTGIWAFAVIVPFVALLTKPIKPLWHMASEPQLIFAAGIVLAWALTLGLLKTRRRWLFWVIVGVFAVLGQQVIAQGPAHIDVYEFQRAAGALLRSGGNPYAMQFANIYVDESFYGPGLVVDGRLQFGFLYPPLTLLCTTLGTLFGDPRWAMLVALLAAAIIAGLGTPSAQRRVALALLLFMPRSLFVLEQSWTEPLIVLGVALVIAAERHAPRLSPLALGALLAAKQYVFVGIPLLDRRPRAWLIAALFATGITLPFFLWAPGPFLDSVLLLQLKQPFRADSLSFPALAHHFTGWTPPGALGFVAAGAAGAFVWRRTSADAERSARLLAFAFVFFSFFSFSKQAFCNYYFLVAALLWLSLATAEDTEPLRPSAEVL